MYKFLDYKRSRSLMRVFEKIKILNVVSILEGNVY